MLSSGIWLEAASLSDSSLSDMVPGLTDLQLDAKAPSTVLKYKSGWLRWREWALSKFGVPLIPAKPLHIALFISELAKRSSENNIGVSPYNLPLMLLSGATQWPVLRLVLLAIL